MTKFRLNIYAAAEPNRYAYSIYSVYEQEDPESTETWRWRYSNIQGAVSAFHAKREAEALIESFKKTDQAKEDWAERRKTIEPQVTYYE